MTITAFVKTGVQLQLINLTGIGKVLTRELAQQKRQKNNKVYMLCRNMESCERTRQQLVVETKNK